MSYLQQFMPRDRDWKIFVCAMVPFLAILAFLPQFCQWNYRSDVLEMVIYGREWLLSTNRHPCMPGWIVEILGLLTGRADCTPYLACALCDMVIFISTWILAKQYLSRSLALLATLSMMTYWYFNIGFIIYNNGVPLAMFWVMAVLFFHFALKTGRNRYWILTGVALAGALLSKYTAIILVLTMVIYLLCDHRVRRMWKTPGPWLTTIVAFLLFLPHFISMLNNLDSVLEYSLSKKTSDGVTFLISLFQGWCIQISRFGLVVLAVFPVLALPLRFRNVEALENAYGEKPMSFMSTFWSYIVILPILFWFALQLIFRIAFPLSAYGLILWLFTGIYVIWRFETTTIGWRWRLATFWIFLFTFLEIVSLPIQAYHTHNFSTTQSIRFYPGKAIAQEVDAVWKAYSPTMPCPFVSTKREDEFLAWNVICYSAFRPSYVLSSVSKYTDADMNQSGGVLVWLTEADEKSQEQRMPDDIQERFPDAIFIKNADFKYQQRNPNIEPVHVGIAIVPPATSSL